MNGVLRVRRNDVQRRPQRKQIVRRVYQAARKQA